MAEGHSEEPRTTADEQLAHEIVCDLVTAELISTEQGAKLLPMILAGRVGSHEWCALFELARPASAQAKQSSPAEQGAQASLTVSPC